MSAAARREIIEREATETFGERGYHGTSMEEIAARSGVSVPVVYDHFSSKRELHRRLLERHFAELRDLWRERLSGGGEPGAGQIAHAFDAWFGYIEARPYAWRMLFHDTTGDARVRAEHAAVIAESREALLPFFARQIGLPPYEPGDVRAELAWEACRAVLQGFALWWLDRRDVPRERVVRAAMDALWLGFGRVREGERWDGDGDGQGHGER